MTFPGTTPRPTVRQKETRRGRSNKENKKIERIPIHDPKLRPDNWRSNQPLVSDCRLLKDIVAPRRQPTNENLIPNDVRHFNSEANGVD